MPFEIMDQRGGTESSRFFEDICFPPERQIGFWKQHTHSDYPGVDGRAPSSGCKLVAAPLERFSPAWALPVDYINLPQSLPTRDQKEMLPIGTGGENMPKTSWNSIDQPKSLSNVSLQSSSYSLGSNTIGISGTQWESSLFSSSVSDIFSRKLRLSGDEVHSHQRVKPIISSHEEYEAFDSIEEIEAQTIGNLLPAEDDLFSGVTDEFGHKTHANSGDDLEDFDLFSSGGGLELEGEDRMSVGKRDSILCGGGSNGSVVGEHPYGEHPSRTLFVRNINSNVEDSELEAIFKQFGDIRNLYTACKHRGFVMISYYDIRAARNAMRTLQNKPLQRRKLDIHYSIPKDNPSDKDIYQGTLLVLNLDPSVSKEELHQIFGFYGEIKQIHETTQKHNQKFIEYYDIRAAEAALSALNQSEIAGKQIKLEPMGAILSHVGAFSESHQSSSVPANSLSPAAMASVGKQFGHHETNCSVDEMKFSNQQISSFHPHSLPEYHDNLVDGIPYHSSSTLGDRSGSFGSKVTERIGSRHIQGVGGSNGHLMDINGGVFGSPGNGNCSVPGHHYIWNHNRSGQQHPSNRMIWPNSPSFVNGVQAHHLPHMMGFPGARPVMLNTAPAQHHIGSAPAVNPSLWDRRQAYLGESPEASSFHLGSLGSVGFPVSSPPHPMDITSRSMFSHVAGNCMDIAKIAGQRSSTQMCHVFPGRNPMISMPSSFDSPMDRVRNLSHRRIESNSSHSDKKQYELDLDRILRGDDSRTTLMIKNIPNKYTSKMLLAAIDEFCRGTYDFIYLPIDFKNKCNVGYAFINMTDPQQIIQFHKAFNGKKWEKFNSEKVATLAYARIQGKAALIAHFQNSSLMNEDKRCRPILFHTDGPNAGDPEPFPMGSNIRSRLGKPRSSSNGEHHHHGSPSTFPNGEDSSSGSRSPSGSE